MIHNSITNNIVLIQFDNSKGNLLTLSDLERLNLLLEDSLQFKGLILTGLRKSYCTGVAVEKCNAEDYFFLLDTILIKLFEYPKPVVSFLSGHAIGAGLLFLCCSDYIISAPNQNSKFGLPEVKLGLGVDGLMVEILRSSFSMKEIRTMLLTSEYIGINNLLNLGLINCYNETADIRSAYDFINGILNIDAYIFCKKLLRQQTAERIRCLLNDKCYMSLVSLANNIH